MVQAPYTPETLYPDSDGQPMSDNTEQYDWIVRIVSNLKYLLKDEIAFVAGDLLWYPVQVDAPPAPRQAPDALVAFGRPSGYRGSYKQWEEDNIAPQVVFEILSPSNTHREMAEKQNFYDTHGVLESYYYDPDSKDFWGFSRSQPGETFTLITPLYLPWTSPLLNIRFELDQNGLVIFHPDGNAFELPGQVFAERDEAQAERDEAQAERDAAREKLEQAHARLRELGIDPDQLS